MRLRARVFIVVISAAVGVAISTPARGEEITITITSGSVAFTPNTGSGVGELMQLTGTDGFSLVARLGNGATAPLCCLAPGATTFYRGFWSGGDLLGTATLGGDVFTDVGSLASVNTASVDFVSIPFTMPAAGPQTVSVTAPFTLTGTFRGVPGSGIPPSPATVEATLVGSGIGTVTFNWLSVGPFNVWEPVIARLEITSPDVVPEPGTLILLGASLAGIYVAKRRRRTASRNEALRS